MYSSTCILLLFSGWCLAGDPTSERSVESWFQRAQSYAATLTESASRGGEPGHDLDRVYVTLLDLYVRMGRIREAEALAQTVAYGTPEDQASVRINLAFALAQAGQIEAAIRWAESLDRHRVPDPAFPEKINPSPRERSLLMITVSQYLRHEFAGAEKTIARLRDPEMISSAWRRLAERQAKAGKYDAAARSLAQVTPITQADKRAKQETQRLIEQCRSEGHKAQPQPNDENYFDRFRRSAKLFAEVEVKGDSLDERETAVAEITNPIDRAAAWRQLAWESLRTGNPRRCRRAIQNALAAATGIPDELGYQRAANQLLLADLYLEIGEHTAAVELVRATQDSGRLDQLVQRGLGEFTTAPIAISVFARTAHWDQAVSVARQIGGTGWEALGVVLGDAGELTRAERILETVESERDKAIVCAGVTYGLHCTDRSKEP